MILVVGSTGHMGSEVCRLLSDQKRRVRALVRATSKSGKVDALKERGIETVCGDLRDAASLRLACRGVTTVISTVSSMPFAYEPGRNDIETVDRNGELNLIAAAQEMGVRRFIYTSFSGGIDVPFPLRNAKRAVERHLRDSGLAFTILRPSFFMETWLTAVVGFDAANARAQIYGTGEQRISWISRHDAARFAAAAVDNLAAQNTALELGGPEALSPHAVIRLYEQATKRVFDVTRVSTDSLREQLRSATDPMHQSFLNLMLCYAHGDLIDMRQVLGAFQLPLRSVKDHIRETITEHVTA